MRLVARGQKRDARACGLLQRRHGFGGVVAVAQHGGGEHVDALALEVPCAFQVPLEHRRGALDARLRERPFAHVGGKAGHDLVVEKAAEVLVRVDGAPVVLHLVHDEAHRIRSQVDDAVVGHGFLRSWRRPQGQGRSAGTGSARGAAVPSILGKRRFPRNPCPALGGETLPSLCKRRTHRPRRAPRPPGASAPVAALPRCVAALRRLFGPLC